VQAVLGFRAVSHLFRLRIQGRDDRDREMDKVRTETLVRIHFVIDSVLLPLDGRGIPQDDRLVRLEGEGAALSMEQVVGMPATFLAVPRTARRFEHEPEADSHAIAEPRAGLCIPPFDQRLVIVRFLGLVRLVLALDCVRLLLVTQCGVIVQRRETGVSSGHANEARVQLTPGWRSAAPAMRSESLHAGHSAC